MGVGGGGGGGGVCALVSHDVPVSKLEPLILAETEPSRPFHFHFIGG